jgi:predicted PurR-regulated permease PerM
MTSRSAQRALSVLLLATFILLAMVLRPLAVLLFLAAVLAATLWPLHHRLSRALGRRDSLAAWIVIVGLVALIVGPLVWLSVFLIGEAMAAMQFIAEALRSGGVEGLISKLPDGVEGVVRRLLDQIPREPGANLSETLQRQISGRGSQAAAALGSVVSATGALLLQAVLTFIALFFFLIQKEAILNWIDEVSPLERRQTREILAEVRRVSVAVLRSTVLTAAVQAAVAIVGYYFARVPYPLFFGAVTFFMAMVPALGAAAVCLGTAGLVLATGHPVAAIFLAAWAILAVGLVDNLIKPYLIKRGVGMHSAVVFFALFGGLAAFGAVGILLGPLAVAAFISVLRIYKRDYGKKSPEPAAPAPEELSSPSPMPLVPREV